ncbi:MAG: flavodoxin family protein [Saprospiraceae bacterium]
MQRQKKGIILLGSANSRGETFKVAHCLSLATGFPIVDLKTKSIGGFDYEFKNRGDDFLPLIKDIVANYDLIVFATPVYWYTMSGLLKTFFDRLSDCLMIEKETGRKLRGMEMAVLSCGVDQILKAGFHMPFRETAKYLGMHYLADVHTWLAKEKIPAIVENNLQEFIDQICLKN